MQDQGKTKKQLIDELKEMRLKVAEYQASSATQLDIPERNQVKDELRENEQCFRTLFERHDAVMLLIEPNSGAIIDANAAAAKYYGYSRDTLRRMRIQEINYLPPKEVLAERRRAKLEERNYFVFLHRLANGETRTVEVHSSPIDIQGRTLLFSIIHDITDRKRAEDALRESEQKYRAVVDGAHEGILVAQDGKICFVNPRVCEMVGFEVVELLDRPFTEFIHPDDRDLVPQSHYRRLKGEKFQNRYSLRLIVKDGTERCFDIDSRLISWGGEPASVVFLTDITEQIRMEYELKNSEELYHSLVENSFDGVFLQKGPKIAFANSRLYEMLGYSKDELVGMDHWAVYHRDDREIIPRRSLARMRKEQVPNRYEARLLRKDGTSFHAEISAREVTVKGLPGLQVWVRDITKQRRSEKVQRRLAAAVEQAAESIIVTDTNGNIEYVNPAFESITGYTRDEAIGKTPEILSSGTHDQKFYKDLWDVIARGDVWRGEFVNRRKDGTLYQEDCVISPVRDSLGKLVNFVSIGRDKTLEIELRKQLFWAQKMEAIGTLTGGIAHDFNNLLQVVLGYSELMLQRKKGNETDYTQLLHIHEAGKRGVDLIQRLLTFSRKIEPNLRPVNLNQQVIEIEGLLSRTIPRNIKIDLHLGADLELIRADPSQIGQIIMNLGVNARDAMPEGGTLSVITANDQLDQDFCRRHLGAKPGRYVSLTVSDTGYGMDQEIQLHIFEPFFTTKEVGKGTGLGLATVYGIVKLHDGYIICYSEPEHGTTFKICFPAISFKREPQTKVEETLLRGGSETILLIDDDTSVRDWGTEILSSVGYKVLTATNGKEALEIYQRERERISLVILDLIMPEMGGKQFLTEILGINTKGNVLVVSGFPVDKQANSMLAAGAKAFVQKPFNAKQLLDKIRQILDED
ncbi:MAG: PAS domain S-box protein [Desulfomonilaceae bacterium]